MAKRKGFVPDPLSFTDLAEGIELAFNNALSLFHEAELLLRGGFSGRALASLLTSEQEIGKMDVLQSMARIHPTRRDQWAQKWREFRDHDYKAARGLVEALPDPDR